MIRSEVFWGKMLSKSRFVEQTAGSDDELWADDEIWADGLK